MRSHVTTGRRAIKLSIVLGLALGVALSPCCRISEVIVRASTPTLAYELAGKIDIPENANTIFLPIENLQAAAATCHRIRDISVRRAGLRSITIDIEERRPVAAVAADGQYTTVDEQGVCLIRTDTPMELLAIKGLAEQGFALGATLPAAQFELMTACLEGAGEARIGDAAVFDLSNPHLVTVRTHDGVEGKLGELENIRGRTVVFGRLLEGLREKGQHVAYIDVRVEHRPVCREKTAGSS
jgi:cell division protein FtsQ